MSRLVLRRLYSMNVYSYVLSCIVYTIVVQKSCVQFCVPIHVFNSVFIRVFSRRVLNHVPRRVSSRMYRKLSWTTPTLCCERHTTETRLSRVSSLGRVVLGTDPSHVVRKPIYYSGVNEPSDPFTC